MLVADQLAQFAFARFVQWRDAQLEQFVVTQCSIDLVVQIRCQTFLTYGDNRFQIKPVAFCAQALDLSTG